MDGENREYIYYQSNDDVPPATPTQSPQQKGYVPAGWTDHPQGVSEEKQYEYMCTRMLTGATQGEGGTWSAWSSVVLWSKYGERGQDGDGVEYVYTRTADKTPAATIWFDPVESEAYQQDDYLPYTTSAKTTRYTDDMSGVTEELRYEWLSQRKKTGGKWEAFSQPKVWARYSEDGESAFVFDIDNEMDTVPTQ